MPGKKKSHAKIRALKRQMKTTKKGMVPKSMGGTGVKKKK